MRQTFRLGDVAALTALAVGGVVGLALLPALIAARCVHGGQLRDDANVTAPSRRKITSKATIYHPSWVEFAGKYAKIAFLISLSLRMFEAF